MLLQILQVTALLDSLLIVGAWQMKHKRSLFSFCLASSMKDESFIIFHFKCRATDNLDRKMVEFPFK